jgi:hypothetical protein
VSGLDDIKPVYCAALATIAIGLDIVAPWE